MASDEGIEGAMRKIADFGSDCSIMDQAGFTFPFLVPLQAARYAKGDLPDPPEYSYGPHERQKLDVYLPKATSQDAGKLPVLVHAYGGGFALGGKRNFPGVYQNLGHFIADKGFVMVIVDYRLLEHGARFPSGAEDISLALQWLAAGHVPRADLNNVFLLGESAGGIHMSTWLWGSFDGIKPASAISNVHIRGLAFLSIPYHEKEASKVSPPAVAYYGSSENYIANSPLSLRQRSDDATPLLAMYGTYDPKEDIMKNLAWFREYFSNKGTPAPAKLDVYECKGHNHVSLPVTVGLGHGSDEWAYHLVEWMRGLLASRL